MLQHHYKAKELSISEMGLHGYFLGSLSNYITTYAFPIYNIKIDWNFKKSIPTANCMALMVTTDAPMSFSSKASYMLLQSAMKCL